MVSNLNKDLEEVEKFLQQAQSGIVKQTLIDLKNKLNYQIEQNKFKEAANATAKNDNVPKVSSLRPLTKLTTYAYDESENYVKLYYTLKGVQNLSSDKINHSFTDDSFDVTVSDLDGKDYSISAKGFTHPIDPEKSVVKQKEDMLLVMMKKFQSGTWSELLKIVKQKKDEQKKKDEEAFDDKDPQGGLMNMMKKLYEEGDDDMKRSLKKAWFESQTKKQDFAGGDLGLDS